MHGTKSLSYLSDDFLDRVRRSYVLHFSSRDAGRCWAPINDRRSDIHAALLADTNSSLREIFADPTSTDLYYGVDNLCRSIGPISPENFTTEALTNFRGRIAEHQGRRVIEAADSLDVPVIEIGPGMGRVAYFAYRTGLADYTTIDLPLGVVAQACFLARVLHPDEIWFQGESDATSAGRIKLLYAGKLPQRRYAIALNMDSLPEMPAVEAFEYAQWFSTHTAVFLSLNREHVDDFTVSEVVAFACGAKPGAREECAIWPGYFEETYAFTNRRPWFGPAHRKAFKWFVKRRQEQRP